MNKKYKALTTELKVINIELSAQDIKDLNTGHASYLDFECHYVFINHQDWLSFKQNVTELDD